MGISEAKSVTSECVRVYLEEHHEHRYFELSYAKSDWEVTTAELQNKPKLKRAKNKDICTQLCCSSDSYRFLFVS